MHSHRRARPRVAECEPLERRRLFAAGELDASFGSAGTTTTDFNGQDDFGVAMAVLGNGNIAVVGSATHANTDQAIDQALAIYDADGGLVAQTTTPFEFGGNSQASGIAVQNVGGSEKLLVSGIVLASGTPQFRLTRYDTSGGVDTSFGVNGFAGAGGFSGGHVVVNADGTIVAGANVTGGDLQIAHFDANGFPGALPLLDFGAGGSDDFSRDFAVLDNGQIIVGGAIETGSTGADFAVARYNADGSIDSTFGTGGKTTLDFNGRDDFVGDLAIQPDDGKIILVGTAGIAGGRTAALARFNANGSVDTSFGGGGTGSVQFPNGGGVSVAIAPDGKIVMGGTTTEANAPGGLAIAGFAVSRFNPDGTPDTDFGTGGRANVSFQHNGADAASGATAVAIQPGGRIVLAGSAYSPTSQLPRNDFALAGFDGSSTPLGPDTSAPTGATLASPPAGTTGAASFDFTVNYTDDRQIDTSSFGDADVIVTAPDGVTTIPATFVSSSGTAKSRAAVYRIAAGGGTLDAADAGSYSVALAASQVSDATGNFAAAGAIGAFNLTVAPAGPAPDVTVALGGPGLPASVVGGAPGFVTVTVSNSVGATAALNEDVTINVLVSADATADAGDSGVFTVTKHLKLASGKHKAFKVKFNYPSGLAEQGYYVLAKAIPATDDADPANNVGASATQVTIAPPFVDLGFDPAVGATLPTKPLVRGKKTKASLTLRNAGNVLAKGVTSVDVLASTDQTLDGADPMVATVTGVKLNVKNGATKKVKVSFTVPADFAPGTYFPILVIHPQTDVAETGGADNTLVLPVQITVA